MSANIRPILSTCFIALSAVLFAGASFASSLEGRDLDGIEGNGFEAFYDRDINVTWLRAATENDADWYTLKAWAEEDRYGIAGWRLPKTDTSCIGLNCLNSELAHLWYVELGNMGSMTNFGDFQNVLASRFYWSSNEYEPDPTGAWGLAFNVGEQTTWGKVSAKSAIAVIDGDVSAVPEPPVHLLLLAGLGSLAFLSRCKRSR